MKPVEKPAKPNFSSGPCSKRPGYDVNALSIDTLKDLSLETVYLTSVLALLIGHELDMTAG